MPSEYKTTLELFFFSLLNVRPPNKTHDFFLFLFILYFNQKKKARARQSKRDIIAKQASDLWAQSKKVNTDTQFLGEKLINTYLI